MITLNIDPYYNNAYKYFSSNIYDKDAIFFNYSIFHRWLETEYNAIINVPKFGTDYFGFNSIEDQIAFKLMWS